IRYGTESQNTWIRFLVNTCILKDYNTSSWAWWCMPVIPATWEAKAGRSLELRGSGLWCAMPIRCPVPLTAWPAGG
uniref:Uncharacterized protein n=1 Tax=Chelydra serpentina TaxID=8475 RepID=A0A8C3XLI8_CHESE